MASSLPETYLAAVVSQDGGDFVIQSQSLRQPAPREVLVKVLACGVCRTDDSCRMGAFGGPLPHVPGHEIVGDIAVIGSEVKRFVVNERVGGTFHGGHDGTCRACSRGQFQYCENKVVTSGASPGGYAEYVILREEAAVRLPKDANPVEIAPLMCAGLTVFNGIRNMQIKQGNLVAVHGLGGLGHMAVQYASKMGYDVVALSRGEDKRTFAKQLGANHYIDTTAEDPVDSLQRLGGAALIVATAPSPEAMSLLLGGLQTCGKLLMLAAVGPLPFDSNIIVGRGVSVHSSLVGNAVDAEEAVGFALKNDIKCMVESFPLQSVQMAFDAMMNNKVRFRAVLEMGK